MSTQQHKNTRSAMLVLALAASGASESEQGEWAPLSAPISGPRSASATKATISAGGRAAKSAKMAGLKSPSAAQNPA